MIESPSNILWKQRKKETQRVSIISATFTLKDWGYQNPKKNPLNGTERLPLKDMTWAGLDAAQILDEMPDLEADDLKAGLTYARRRMP